MDDEQRQPDETTEEKEEFKLSPEILSFIGAFVLLVSAFVAASLYWWALLWVLFGLVLGFVEYLSWRKTGEALSEAFGRILREKPTTGWSLLALMIAAFGALIWHLIAMR
jgi:phosphoglycerol transferase MdoB-like AlkP superfamily enzyme